MFKKRVVLSLIFALAAVPAFARGNDLASGLQGLIGVYTVKQPGIPASTTLGGTQATFVNGEMEPLKGSAFGFGARVQSASETQFDQNEPVRVERVLVDQKKDFTLVKLVVKSINMHQRQVMGTTQQRQIMQYVNFKVAGLGLTPETAAADLQQVADQVHAVFQPMNKQTISH